jgi:serpin B
MRIGTGIAIVGLLMAAAVLPDARSGEPDQAATGRARDEVAKTTKAITTELTQGCNQFAFDLYRQAADKQKKAVNIVVAPYSVAEALALAYAGARGKTAEEIAKTLHLKVKPDQAGPAFASLGIGGGGHLADELAPTKYRFGARVRDGGGEGVEITDVKQGSPAWEAGLRPKERIIRLGEKGIRDTVEYANALDTFIDMLDGEVAGAQGNRRFSATLNPPASGKKRLRPLIANAFWGSKDLQFTPAFKETASLYYNAAVASLDFAGNPQQARLQINRWVADATDDNITNLLPPDAITKQTGLVLINAVYLESGWRSAFKPDLTSDETFYGAGKKRKVPMMHKSAQYRFGQGEDFQVIELGLEGDFAMAFYLPARKGGKDALAEFESEKFTLENLTTWLEKLRMVQVNLTLPRFRIAAGADLQTSLAGLGMPTAFTKEADFSGMAPTGKLALSSVIHNADVEVNEKGVRATATTGVVAAPRERPVADFTADHPFLFTIRDSRKGVILFVGRVMFPDAD